MNNAQKLPGSRKHPIYHAPGSVTVNSIEDLFKLYPNSFDKYGTLKGEYNIKIDSNVQPVQCTRRKVQLYRCYPVISSEAHRRNKVLS